MHPEGHVALGGVLDVASLDALRVALDQALLGSDDLIRLDAAELEIIDSAAISELLRYQLIAISQQKRFSLENVSGLVALILDLLDLRDLLVELIPDDLHPA
jgi:anti-anti-sigma regulatory factor